MSAYRDWKVGDQVVCVETWDEQPQLGYGNEVGPVSGTVYTIREVGFLIPDEPSALSVRLREIVNLRQEYSCGFWEQSFRATRFRPVVKRTTSIAIFRALLHPSEHDKKALIEHERKEDAAALADGLYGEVKFS